ncbi:hypothetical protein ASE04_10420 [Rhizobium sp. Root708]|uniref:hypothetical protein n=1 Tax=Rhizobium sp. Root708 TaxID=1736592 RepID=UPI0006FE15FA|nr:hypothetical protein [Rhizobium sp. Root708]KRB51926.1 hypothetical protein ASE04_10420 [Rhizobium sp. Root708]
MKAGEKPSRIVGVATVLCLMGSAPAWAGCKSATYSPEWRNISHAISTAQLCEQLPVGPNRTSSFRVLSADVCSSGDGVASVRATALLTCETGDDALFQMAPVEGKVVATISLDMAACRITDTHIEIDGEIGSLLSGLPDTQDFGRNWAQSQLSRLCQLR